MKPPLSAVLLLPLLLASAPVLAGSPGPSARQATLGLGVCLGGAFEGESCVDAGDCDDGSGAKSGGAICTSQTLDLEIRGFLTLISDKDAGRFESTETVPHVIEAVCADGPFRGRTCERNADCRTPEQQSPVCREEILPADFSKSALALILDFTKDGERYVFSEIYKDLGDYVDPDRDIECRGFCIPVGLPGSVGWREPAVEPRIANPDEGDDSGAGGGGGGGGGGGAGGGDGGRAGGEGIRIRWAQAPPAIASALIEALRLPPGTVPFLEFTNTVAIFDHAAEDDPLATWRQLKVTIRFLARED